MPKWLICIPLAAQWLWLSVRYRGTTLPSCVNPMITSGGLVGEGKLEYFATMGSLARSATAPFVGVAARADLSESDLKRAMAATELTFPIIAKPDLGLCGFGVRRINDMAELIAYFAAFPPNETVVLQAFLQEEHEAGIFYARDPAAGQGRIIGLVLRYFPRVVGDGERSVRELMITDHRARRMLAASKHESVVAVDRVPSRGEMVRLATIGSTRVGGLYVDGGNYATELLSTRMDAIARDMHSFYCGRFDVRYASLHDLMEGRFTIIEVNGAGSEAIQAWDPQIGLLKGLGMIFSKQRLLFSIGAQMRKLGVRPIKLYSLYRLYKRQQQLIKHYPPSN